MTISSIASSTASASDTLSRIPKQVLGQDDFLRLLTTQLTSQDPLNPQKDTDFIAQMAQFSALEQSRAVSADIAEMNSRQQVAEASALLGRTVTITTTDDVMTQGVVSAVTVQDGVPRLMVGGTAYGLDQVVSISQPASVS